jgi:hypothetical protein
MAFGQFTGRAQVCSTRLFNNPGRFSREQQSLPKKMKLMNMNRINTGIEMDDRKVGLGWL